MKQIDDDPKKKGQDNGTERGDAGGYGEGQSINESYGEGSTKGIVDDKPTPGYDSAIPDITDVFDFPKDFDE